MLRHWPSYIRCFSTSNISPLPPIAEWRNVFDATHRSRRARVCLSNPQTATRIANSFFPSGESENRRGKVVIEAFPGEYQRKFLYVLCLTTSRRSWSFNAGTIRTPYQPNTQVDRFGRYSRLLSKNSSMYNICLAEDSCVLIYFSSRSLKAVTPESPP